MYKMELVRSMSAAQIYLKEKDSDPEIENAGNVAGTRGDGRRFGDGMKGLGLCGRMNVQGTSLLDWCYQRRVN